MKRQLVTNSFLFLFAALHAQPEASIKDWKKNFGFVKRGDTVRKIYEIKNTGTQPLLIYDAEVSCSCTQVEFSKEPVLAGQQTTVVIIFNTKTVYGRQDREVFLKTNAGLKPLKLRYKGVVVGK